MCDQEHCKAEPSVKVGENWESKMFPEDRRIAGWSKWLAVAFDRCRQFIIVQKRRLWWENQTDCVCFRVFHCREVQQRR